MMRRLLRYNSLVSMDDIVHAQECNLLFLAVRAFPTVIVLDQIFATSLVIPATRTSLVLVTVFRTAGSRCIGVANGAVRPVGRGTPKCLAWWSCWARSPRPDDEEDDDVSARGACSCCCCCASAPPPVAPRLSFCSCACCCIRTRLTFAPDELEDVPPPLDSSSALLGRRGPGLAMTTAKEGLFSTLPAAVLLLFVGVVVTCSCSRADGAWNSSPLGLTWTVTVLSSNDCDNELAEALLLLLVVVKKDVKPSEELAVP